MPVKIIDNTAKLVNKNKADSAIAIRKALEDVKNISRPITPLRDTTKLRNNIKIEVSGLRGKIEWSVPYASYQERGKRYDGSHKVKKYTTPGTGKGFAQKSIKQVQKDIGKYYRFTRIV